MPIRNRKLLFFLLLSTCLISSVAYTADDKDSDSDATEVMVNKIDKANQQVKKEQQPVKETCQCQFAGSEANVITFETPEACGPNRNYLNDDLKKTPVEYKSNRSQLKPPQSFPPADFPLKCITYAQRYFADFCEGIYRGSQKSGRDPLKFLAKCPDKNGPAVRFVRPPCVTSEYSNLVYNSFVDVTDCLDISARELMPKISNESGFHINAHSAKGDDSGIGQLTAPAIQDVQGNMAGRITAIKSSKKTSCQRLAKYPGLFDSVSASSEHRCGLIAIPANPLRNLFYAGLVQKNNENYVEYFFKKKDITTLLKKAGLSLTDTQTTRLKSMLISLAYNAGAGSSVTYLYEYLRSKLNTKTKIKLADFDIAAKAKGSFALYLKENQTSGAPGYLNALASQKQNLDKAIGNNICTLETYLKL